MYSQGIRDSLTISKTCTLPVEKATAFGPDATGNMKAKDVDTATGNIK